MIGLDVGQLLALCYESADRQRDFRGVVPGALKVLSLNDRDLCAHSFHQKRGLPSTWISGKGTRVMKKNSSSGSYFAARPNGCNRIKPGRPSRNIVGKIWKEKPRLKFYSFLSSWAMRPGQLSQTPSQTTWVELLPDLLKVAWWQSFGPWTFRLSSWHCRRWRGCRDIYTWCSCIPACQGSRFRSGSWRRTTAAPGSDDPRMTGARRTRTFPGGGSNLSWWGNGWRDIRGRASSSLQHGRRTSGAGDRWWSIPPDNMSPARRMPVPPRPRIPSAHAFGRQRILSLRQPFNCQPTKGGKMIR